MMQRRSTIKGSFEEEDVALLVSMFPDIDRQFARFCLQAYNQDKVASVAEKLLDANFGAYPKHNFNDSFEAKNALLDDLNDLFPEHDVTELRQALTLPESSNLYTALDTLLARETKQAKSKTKEPTIRTRVGLDRGVIPTHQRFRSEEYQTAVLKRLKLEFAQHDSSSTIRAVLSENNFDYERTRAALSQLFSKRSLWSTLKALFPSRAKEVAMKQLRECPLTGCAELDAEIEDNEGRKRRVVQGELLQKDEILAKQVNEDEHTLYEAMTECGCCFGEYTWEDITACKDGHLVCRSCVTRTIEECAFGQGDTYTLKGLRCIAATSEPCAELIPTYLLEGIISTGLLKRLNSRIINGELERSKMELVRCPFCLYAEFKDPVYPPRIRFRSSIRDLLVLILLLMTLLNPVILGNITVPLIILIRFTDVLQWKEWQTSVANAYQRRHTKTELGARVFRCENKEECGRESCILCAKEWAPFHDCLQDEKDGLRLFVEKAMADAVKRTCPRCNVGFIKSDGCNLMHCRCGFVMCYVCREDVGATGYKHFCQHFRPFGGACTKCSQCGLYDREDEEEAIQEARMRAMEEYIARRPAASNIARMNYNNNDLLRRRRRRRHSQVQVEERRLVESIAEILMEHGGDILFEAYT